MRENVLSTKLLFKKITASREVSLVIVLMILCAFIQLRNPSFLTGKVMIDMFKNYSVTMILALGMMGVLLIGGIDISIGSTLALSGMSMGLLMRDGIITNTFAAILVSVLVGLAGGAFVGVIIAQGRVLPIIATLGFMNVYRGVTYLVADSQWVAAYQVTDHFKEFAQSSSLSFGLVNNLITIMAVCYLIFFFVMKWTRMGRRIYAVGSNAEAAEISGIRINRVKMLVYSVMGALCGLAGALWVSLYASAQGDMAKGIEMDVIAACVIGGVSLNGGRGSVVGVFLGSVTIAIIGKALPLIGISQFWQNGIKGVIILAAVILNVLTQRVMDKNNLRGKEM